MTATQGVLPMPRRAYSYLRISDPKQARGDGLDRQEGFAERICAQNKWCLDDSLRFVDRGKSGFHGDNRLTGALGQFLAAVRSKRIAEGSVLIVENLDRLSREKMDEAYDQFRGIL